MPHNVLQIKLVKIMEEKIIEILQDCKNGISVEICKDDLLNLCGVSKSLNEFLPLRLKKGQKVVVTKNKTSHCYKVGDVLRIIKPHYRYKDAWYCKKGWFGTKQVLTEQEFYVC
tara:strand:- start:36 stop:377 length:342 start_codon:yes stop_codon:yes gene_type:complete